MNKVIYLTFDEYNVGKTIIIISQTLLSSPYNLFYTFYLTIILFNIVIFNYLCHVTNYEIITNIMFT